VRHAIRRKQCASAQSVIVVDEKRKTRTILFDTDGAVGADDKMPSKELIGSAKVLFVDSFGIKE